MSIRAHGKNGARGGERGWERNDRNKLTAISWSNEGGLIQSHTPPLRFLINCLCVGTKLWVCQRHCATSPLCPSFFFFLSICPLKRSHDLHSQKHLGTFKECNTKWFCQRETWECHFLNLFLCVKEVEFLDFLGKNSKFEQTVHEKGKCWKLSVL